jgi:hypothetical protein
LSSSEIQARILNNARAALWDTFRNEALRADPTLTGDALEAAAAEVRRKKLSAAGKKGRQAAAERQAAANAAIRLLPAARDT